MYGKLDNSAEALVPPPHGQQPMLPLCIITEKKKMTKAIPVLLKHGEKKGKLGAVSLL